jgi:hypothetical protein
MGNNSEAKEGFISPHFYEILKFISIIIFLDIFFKFGNTQIFVFGNIDLLICLSSCITKYTIFRKLALFICPRESLRGSLSGPMERANQTMDKSKI